MQGRQGEGRQKKKKKTMVKFVRQCKMQIHRRLTALPRAQTDPLDRGKGNLTENRCAQLFEK
jgi:hypothetical protein